MQSGQSWAIATLRCSFPWPLLILLSPFKTLFREMREMRYLWQDPLRLSNDRLLSVLKTEPHTPLDRPCVQHWPVCAASRSLSDTCSPVVSGDGVHLADRLPHCERRTLGARQGGVL